MFRLLVEKELRDALHSPKFYITFLACALLILLSFGVGARSFVTAKQQHEAAVAENLRQLEGLTDWLRVRDHQIFLPPEPLAALVSGISSDVGRTIPVAGRGELTADGTVFNEEPALAVFRFLDLDFLFSILLTLFAIVFAFDAVTGEKERGTLRLTLANALPRSTLILGKIAGVALSLVVPLLIPLLLGCLLLPVLGVFLGGQEYARLALVLLGGLLLVAAFVALSVLVSAATRRSSSAFLVLLTIWIGSVLVLPRVAVMAAGRAVAVPSLDENNSQKTRLAMQLARESREALTSLQMNQTGAGDPESIMKDFQKRMEELQTERDRKMGELCSRLDEERENRSAWQSRLALGLARISPTAVFSLAATELAGTSTTLPRRFLDQAKAYQQEFGKFMVAKTGINPGGGMVIMRMVGGQEDPKPIDPRELPPFQYAPVQLAEVLPSGCMDLGLLVVFGAVFVLGAVVQFQRYDVR
jgi:ABC-type transport system involved in multi-copper enzyme maturation permease subunit